MNETETNESAGAPRAPGRRANRWIAVLALAVAGIAFLVVTFGGIGRNLVYYWGPSELRAAGAKAIGATIRLGGQVAPGSVKRTGGAAGVTFDVIDTKGARVHVDCASVPPQMFREGIGVVVEGTMTEGGTFAGNRLMVSHGNEYRAPSEHGEVDMEKLIRSTEGLDEKGGEAR